MYLLERAGQCGVAGSRGTHADLTGARGFSFAPVRAFGGRLAGDAGIWCVIETSQHKKLRRTLKQLFTHKSKARQDIWKQFSNLTETNEKELNFVSCDKCAKVFVYNGRKSGTSGDTYLSKLYVFIYLISFLYCALVYSLKRFV